MVKMPHFHCKGAQILFLSSLGTKILQAAQHSQKISDFIVISMSSVSISSYNPISAMSILFVITIAKS